MDYFQQCNWFLIKPFSSQIFTLFFRIFPGNPTHSYKKNTIDNLQRQHNRYIPHFALLYSFISHLFRVFLTAESSTFRNLKTPRDRLLPLVGDSSCLSRIKSARVVWKSCEQCQEKFAKWHQNWGEHRFLVTMEIVVSIRRFSRMWKMLVWGSFLYLLLINKTVW